MHMFSFIVKPNFLEVFLEIKKLTVKLFQDIEVEIPVQFQRTVTFVYYVFLTYVLALTVNLFASFFYMLFGGGSIGIFLLAIIQIVLFSSCSFLFWFRPVYKAFRSVINIAIKISGKLGFAVLHRIS